MCGLLRLCPCLVTDGIASLSWKLLFGASYRCPNLQHNKMIADGHLVGDGSWELKVLVTDLAVERCLRVKGDLHIGGVMLRLVEELGNNIN